MDEFFEVITLMQTKKVERAPIILVGDEFWGALDMFVREILLKSYSVISKNDDKLYTITEDLDEIKKILNKHERKQVAKALGS